MEKAPKYRELIRLQEDSGLTVREFCSNEGISYSTFYYWRKKLRNQKNNGDFIPLVVKSNESALSNGYHQNHNTQRIQSRQVTDDPVWLELVYPNGTTLRVKNDLDLAHLRALIHLGD
jgi:hypothetical protein